MKPLRSSYEPSHLLSAQFNYTPAHAHQVGNPLIEKFRKMMQANDEQAEHEAFMQHMQQMTENK